MQHGFGDSFEAFAQFSTWLIVAERSIFPKCVPASVHEYFVSPDELASQYKEVQDWDTGDVFVSDGSAPRSGCGKRGISCLVREEKWPTEKMQRLFGKRAWSSSVARTARPCRCDWVHRGAGSACR